ncbi:MAG: ABC transporter substrate-binding protein [Actinobacteria bacterium]|nr:MAG: ABC transporter substrate-binding protein [Actinomycetota bacterium]
MEDAKFALEETMGEGLTRRELVRRTAAAGAGLGLLGTISVEDAFARTDKLDRVRWISPRGTLDVMDDYNIRVPIQMGYYKKLNIDARLNAGAGSGEMQLVAANKIDMGYPSPGVLSSAVDAGIPVIGVWEQYPAQVFDFVLPGDSKITSPADLAGKKIAVLTIGWKAIIDPILADAGVDPSSVKYVELGTQWVQAVARGQADAGLAWEGLRAQLNGEAAHFGAGFSIKFLIGAKFSKDPSNVYAIRKAELSDAKKRDIYTRFLAGVVMGFEFARANPRAAAQITYSQLPALQSIISPQVAVESMVQLASGYSLRKRNGGLWGSFDQNAWNGYLATIAKLGQTKKQLKFGDIIDLSLIAAANKRADVARARRDAKAFKVDQYFKRTKLPAGLPL